MKSPLMRNIVKNNPVFTMLLGIVPVLGCTTFILDAAVMGAVTFFVLACSTVFISLIRTFLSKQTYLFIYIITTAFFVTIASVAVQIFSLEIYSGIGIYFPLIVLNSLILSEFGMSAIKRNVFKALKKSVRTGIYFLFALLVIAVIRELLGRGTMLSYIVIPEVVPKMLILQTAPGGFLLLAVMCMSANLMKGSK